MMGCFLLQSERDRAWHKPQGFGEAESLSVRSFFNSEALFSGVLSSRLCSFPFLLHVLEARGCRAQEKLTSQLRPRCIVECKHTHTTLLTSQPHQVILGLNLTCPAPSRDAHRFYRKTRASRINFAECLLAYESGNPKR